MCICFPGSTTVTTKQGVKRLDELVPGDEILTSRHGVQKWTKFYTWGHRELDVSADFLTLKVEGGRQLQISSEHVLFVAGEEGKGKVTKRAGQVCVGDKLYHFNEKIGSLETLKVIETCEDKCTGVFTPFTMTGTFLADGFLVTCYANVDNFGMAHSVLAPLRFWYRLRQHSEKMKKADKEGIHDYALGLMKFRALLPASIQKVVKVLN